MPLPKGYREILFRHTCGTTVPFYTWDGADHLPMVVRCSSCGAEVTHAQALAFERLQDELRASPESAEALRAHCGLRITWP